MGGLGSRPSLKMECFQSSPSLKNEGDFGTKNNKEMYIFKRGGLLEQPRSEKWKQIHSFENGGLSERSRSKKWSL